jgi:threonine efflux protein
MMTGIDLPLILAAAFIATVSPGPATLAIAGTSMNSGRKYGLALASGIFTGSMIWSVSAAFGLGAIMLANAWAFEIARYVGACYLLYLAYLSARSALRPGQATAQGLNVTSLHSAWMKGLALHLTNPKAILFFGALFSVGVPANSNPAALAIVIGAIALQSFLVFHLYAIIFSGTRITAGYAKLQRWFDALFALGFGAAGAKILTTKLTETG